MEKSFYPDEKVMQALEKAVRGSHITKEGFMLLNCVSKFRIKFILEYRGMLDEAKSLGQSKAGKKRRRQAIRFGVRVGAIVPLKGKYPAKKFGRGWKRMDNFTGPHYERDIKRRG